MSSKPDSRAPRGHTLPRHHQPGVWSIHHQGHRPLFPRGLTAHRPWGHRSLERRSLENLWGAGGGPVGCWREERWGSQSRLGQSAGCGGCRAGGPQRRDGISATWVVWVGGAPHGTAGPLGDALGLHSSAGHVLPGGFAGLFSLPLSRPLFCGLK